MENKDKDVPKDLDTCVSNGKVHILYTTAEFSLRKSVSIKSHTGIKERKIKKKQDSVVEPQAINILKQVLRPVPVFPKQTPGGKTCASVVQLSTSLCTSPQELLSFCLKKLNNWSHTASQAISYCHPASIQAA